MVIAVFWPRRNTALRGPLLTVIWCGVSSPLKKVMALPAMALIIAGRKAKLAIFTSSPPAFMPPAFTSVWPSLGKVLFSLAREMTKSCLACGRWQVKQALLFALALG